jgi:hypothetical protein
MDAIAVYVLQHRYELNGCDETKLIGPFRTREGGGGSNRRPT